MEILTNPDVEVVFDRYPDHVRDKILTLRTMIRETASELAKVSHLEETLRWGEPSFITKKGSTIRIDWKEKTPDQYAIYFKCTSRLVDTFRMTYTDLFRFEGSRAIVFQLEEQVPKTELKQCIKAALTYHQVKHLPSLGIS